MSLTLGRPKNWRYLYGPITDNGSGRICVNLLVYSVANYAVADDGAFHHVTARCYELFIRRATEYRTNEGRLNGVIWQFFQHINPTTFAHLHFVSYIIG